LFLPFSTILGIFEQKSYPTKVGFSATYVQLISTMMEILIFLLLVPLIYGISLNLIVLSGWRIQGICNSPSMK